MTMMIHQSKINHVAFVLDESGSMTRLRKDVVSVFDGQVKWLADLSRNMNQETRVSIYTLSNTDIRCPVFDMDVLRLPSLAGHYMPNGGTPLLDATLKSIEDLKKTAQMYGDHGFLVFVLTDGQENTSRTMSPNFTVGPFGRQDRQPLGQYVAQVLGELPGNWTVGCLVPDFQAKLAAENFGFPKGNIAIWDVNSATGVSDAGQEIKQATQDYFIAREAGTRGTKTLFANQVTKEQVQAAGLQAVDPDKFFIFPAVATGNMAVHIPRKSILKSRPEGIKHVEIKEMVESTGRRYVLGDAYYELTKSEKITGNKQVAVVEVATNKVFTGKQARQLIGLDEYSKRVRPMPKTFPQGKPEFDIFIQSESTNRLLPVGSRVLLFK